MQYKKKTKFKPGDYVISKDMLEEGSISLDYVYFIYGIDYEEDEYLACPAHKETVLTWPIEETDDVMSAIKLSLKLQEKAQKFIIKEGFKRDWENV